MTYRFCPGCRADLNKVPYDHWFPEDHDGLPRVKCGRCQETFPVDSQSSVDAEKGCPQCGLDAPTLKEAGACGDEQAWVINELLDALETKSGKLWEAQGGLESLTDIHTSQAIKIKELEAALAAKNKERLPLYYKEFEGEKWVKLSDIR